MCRLGFQKMTDMVEQILAEYWTEKGSNVWTCALCLERLHMNCSVRTCHCGMQNVILWDGTHNMTIKEIQIGLYGAADLDTLH